MATVTTLERETEAEGDQKVVLPDIGWKGYATLLKLRGERSYPKLVYLDGSVTLVSPLYLHEFLKERLNRFITEVLVGLEIPHIPSGSTTFRRRRKRGGVEGDLTYYLTNWERIRGKR